VKATKSIVQFAVAAVLVALSFAAEAQQPASIPRIGILSPDSIAGRAMLYDAFRQGLRDLGYFEGQNLSFEWRSAEGKLDRLPGLAAELVGLKVDLMVASGTPASQAAKQVTGTVPIVITVAADPMVWACSQLSAAGWKYYWGDFHRRRAIRQASGVA
jgi:putative ABC transport system substrate-binding protein